MARTFIDSIDIVPRVTIVMAIILTTDLLLKLSRGSTYRKGASSPFIF